MTRGRAGPSLKANALMAEYYTQRASAGLIITEGTHTSVMARGFFEAPDIFTAADAEAWKLTTDSVHKAGGIIFMQLWHCGRASHSSFRDGIPGYEGDMKLSVAPSAVKRESKTGKQQYIANDVEGDVETPRALSLEEIKKIPEEYKNAAQTAKDAGFDGIEIHSANGYLLDEFLQSCSNLRTDEYGGSLENRFRLISEVIEAVLTVWPADRVGIRLSPNGSYNGMGSDDFREAFLYYTKRIKEYNLGYLHIMIGVGFGFHEKGEPMTMKEFRDVYPGLMMANVEFNGESGEKQIASGDADMISFGRPFITNPDYVERLTIGAEINEKQDHTTYFSSYGNRLGPRGYTDFETIGKPKA